MIWFFFFLEFINKILFVLLKFLFKIFLYKKVLYVDICSLIGILVLFDVLIR